MCLTIVEDAVDHDEGSLEVRGTAIHFPRPGGPDRLPSRSVICDMMPSGFGGSVGDLAEGYRMGRPTLGLGTYGSIRVYTLGAKRYKTRTLYLRPRRPPPSTSC